ncbi:MAG: hypothetical protein IH616_22095 [Gemmatimonadales bacterium]|nr:hypothetical protein [Gemmatimonadales bacterium]
MSKRVTAGLLIALGAAACSDGAAPGQPGISLSFTTVTGAQSAVAAAPGFFASMMSDTVAASGDTIVITKAEIVLREIELKRVEYESCDASMSNDDCEEFETGPVLLDMPLNGEVDQLVSIPAPVGTYDELEFEIHKVSNDDPSDADFRNQYPHMTGKSIRIEGTYNGTPFVYETDLDVEQETELTSPIEVIDASTSTTVTVAIDLSQWFVDAAGNLVDPSTGNKGGANESLVKENIKRSMKAFEDEDHDGHDDDD